MLVDSYIKQDFVKQVFMESCLIISNIYDAENIAKSISSKCNIIFESSYIKMAFFHKIKQQNKFIRIINCNSSKTRLLQDIIEYDNELIIFDNIKYCTDFDIFNKINKMNRILVC